MEVFKLYRYKKTLPRDQKELLNTVQNFQAQMRDAVRIQLFSQSTEELSQVASPGAGDISYHVDKYAEDFIDRFGEALSNINSVEIISEGVGNKIFPLNTDNPKMKVLVDPVDGTRGIIYDLYSAWVETGISLNKGESTNLSDIDIAVMTEIPPTKQGRGSVVWAVRGQGVYEEIWDLAENRIISIRKLQPSRAEDLKHGFAVFEDPFPTDGGKLADFRKRVLDRVVGVPEGEIPLVFHDQILTTAGQLYNLASGKYRLFVDIKHKLNPNGMANRPYDVAGVLIAEEAGVIITDLEGNKLTYLLDTHSPCDYIGYANEKIREKVEPVLLDELTKL